MKDVEKSSMKDKLQLKIQMMQIEKLVEKSKLIEEMRGVEKSSMKDKFEKSKQPNEN